MNSGSLSWLPSRLSAASIFDSADVVKLRTSSGLGQNSREGSSNTLSSTKSKSNDVKTEVFTYRSNPQQSQPNPRPSDSVPQYTSTSKDDSEDSDASLEEMLRVGAAGGGFMSSLGPSPMFSMHSDSMNRDATQTHLDHRPEKRQKRPSATSHPNGHHRTRGESMSKERERQQSAQYADEETNPIASSCWPETQRVSTSFLLPSSSSRTSGKPTASNAYSGYHEEHMRVEQDSSSEDEQKAGDENKANSLGKEVRQEKEEKTKSSRARRPLDPVVQARLISLNICTQAKKRETYLKEKASQQQAAEKKAERLRRKPSEKSLAVGRRLYEDAVRLRAMKEATVNEAASRRTKERNESCRFHPSLSSGSEKIIAFALHDSYLPPDQRGVQDKERHNEIQWQRLHEQAGQLRSMSLKAAVQKARHQPSVRPAPPSHGRQSARQDQPESRWTAPGGRSPLAAFDAYARSLTSRIPTARDTPSSSPLFASDNASRPPWNYRAYSPRRRYDEGNEEAVRRPSRDPLRRAGSVGDRRVWGVGDSRPTSAFHGPADPDHDGRRASPHTAHESIAPPASGSRRGGAPARHADGRQGGSAASSPFRSARPRHTGDHRRGERDASASGAAHEEKRYARRDDRGSVSPGHPKGGVALRSASPLNRGPSHASLHRPPGGFSVRFREPTADASSTVSSSVSSTLPLLREGRSEARERRDSPRTLDPLERRRETGERKKKKGLHPRRSHPDAVMRSLFARHRAHFAAHLAALFHKFAAHSSAKKLMRAEEQGGKTSASGVGRRSETDGSTPVVTVSQIQRLVKEVYAEDAPLASALAACVSDPNTLLEKATFVQCLMDFLFPLPAAHDHTTRKKKDLDGSEDLLSSSSSSSSRVSTSFSTGHPAGMTPSPASGPRLSPPAGPPASGSLSPAMTEWESRKKWVPTPHHAKPPWRRAKREEGEREEAEGSPPSSPTVGPSHGRTPTSAATTSEKPPAATAVRSFPSPVWEVPSSSSSSSSRPLPGNVCVPFTAENHRKEADKVQRVAGRNEGGLSSSARSAAKGYAERQPPWLCPPSLPPTSGASRGGPLPPREGRNRGKGGVGNGRPYAEMGRSGAAPRNASPGGNVTAGRKVRADAPRTKGPTQTAAPDPLSYPTASRSPHATPLAAKGWLPEWLTVPPGDTLREVLSSSASTTKWRTRAEAQTSSPTATVASGAKASHASPPSARLLPMATGPSSPQQELFLAIAAPLPVDTSASTLLERIAHAVAVSSSASTPRPSSPPASASFLRLAFDGTPKGEGRALSSSASSFPSESPSHASGGALSSGSGSPQSEKEAKRDGHSVSGISFGDELLSLSSSSASSTSPSRLRSTQGAASHSTSPVTPLFLQAHATPPAPTTTASSPADPAGHGDGAPRTSSPSTAGRHPTPTRQPTPDGVTGPVGSLTSATPPPIAAPLQNVCLPLLEEEEGGGPPHDMLHAPPPPALSPRCGKFHCPPAGNEGVLRSNAVTNGGLSPVTSTLYHHHAAEVDAPPVRTTHDASMALQTTVSHSTEDGAWRGGGEGGESHATRDTEGEEVDTFCTTPKYHFSSPPPPPRTQCGEEGSEGRIDALARPISDSDIIAERRWPLGIPLTKESVEATPFRRLDASTPQVASGEGVLRRPPPDGLPFSSTTPPPHYPAASLSFLCGGSPSSRGNASATDTNRITGVPERNTAEMGGDRVHEVVVDTPNVDPSRRPTTSPTEGNHRGTEVDGTESDAKEHENDPRGGAQQFMSEVDQILRTNDEELDKAFQLLYQTSKSVPNVVHI